MPDAPVSLDSIIASSRPRHEAPVPPIVPAPVPVEVPAAELPAAPEPADELLAGLDALGADLAAGFDALRAELAAGFEKLLAEIRSGTVVLS